MKKFFYLAMALSLVACQAEKVDVGGGTEGTEANYLSVNIVTSNAGTRAPGDQYNPDGSTSDNGEYDYEDGLMIENEVTNVRFYFFEDTDGTPAMVKEEGSTWVNYLDYKDNAKGTDHPNSVEKILTTTVVINTKEGDKIPGYIVAVINPPTTLTRAGSQSLTQLNAVIDNLNIVTINGVDDSATGGFVMSNSIYADGGAKVDVVSLEGHMYPDENAAKNNPVKIYVERVLAKVSVSTSLTKATLIPNPDPEAPSITDDSNYFVTQQSKDNANSYQVEGEPVFVHFLGWNVTTTAPKSRLMKEINPAWEDDNLFAGWNWAPIRSFWAVNPTLEATDYQYGDFDNTNGDDVNVNPANAVTDFTNGYTYVQENAAASEQQAYTEKPTQVIISAQLVDKYGQPLTITEYAGRLYAGDTAAKDLIAGAIKNVYVVDEEKTTQTETAYKSITSANLVFMTATTVEGKAPQEGRYYVYAQLAEGNNYYYEVEAGSKNMKQYGAEGAETIASVNEKLVKLGHAKVWNEGKTYYYFDIRHLNDTALAKEGEETDYDAQLRTPGYFGVVRNHVYKSTISKLAGLGTPVFDPKEIIIPERPKEDDTVIAAEIKILSWRIVNNGYDLVW